MMMDRRTLLKSALGGTTTLLLFPRLAASRPQSSGITRLNDTLSLITHVGTNVLALSTTEGVVLVDSGAPQSGPSLIKALSEIAGSRRVQTVFNTHFHLSKTRDQRSVRSGGSSNPGT